jgi:glutamine amidotransferase
MQLFSSFSQEGNLNGLNWINSEVLKFKIKDSLKWKIPHMGWNSVKINKNNVLFDNINDDDFFYFVHSYYLSCNDQDNILTTTKYYNRFVSSINKDNIYGTQFHPEKSHDKGLEILKNFSTKI